MNRQYIGARYVPKLMGEWDKRISYENLVVVTYKGNSYTSKQPVPQGIDIGNTDYWVNTGNYNAQVEEYRNDVNNLIASIPNYSLHADNYTNVYLSNTNGNDNNNGLDINNPLKTITKAFEVGCSLTNEFRIRILDNSSYIIPYLTISNINLHIVGNTNMPTLYFAKKCAIYSGHINFSQCNIDSDTGFYSDNNLAIFNKCVIKCDYVQNGGSLSIVNSEISSIKGNSAFIYLNNCILNNLTHSSRKNSITCDSCCLMISGTLTTNYSISPECAIYVVRTNTDINSELTKRGNDNTRTNLYVSGCNVNITYTRLLTYSYNIVDGGYIQTPSFKTAYTNYEKTFNALIAPFYCVENNKLRVEIFNTDFYPFTSGSATIDSIHAYINNKVIQPNVISTEVINHNSSVIIDITVAENENFIANFTGVLHYSLTLSLTL